MEVQHSRSSVRSQWDAYEEVFEEMLEKTSMPHAPWYVIPADKKFFARVAVGDIILELFRSLDLHYPPAESQEMPKQENCLRGNSCCLKR